jgi:cyanate lyase
MASDVTFTIIGPRPSRVICGSAFEKGSLMLEIQLSSNDREKVAEIVLAAKAERGLSWDDIAEGTGLSVVFVTAAILGQHPLPRDAAEIVGRRLGLDSAPVRLLQTIPMRGGVPGSLPADPTLYRFHEMFQVYGPTLKALVHEKFGDGIISAINFRVALEKVDDPDGGHRAVITLDGKYLPVKPF